MVSTAIMDPGLRSMPPVMMTTVAPRATMLSTATWRAMLRKFSGLRKEGVVTATTTTMRRSAATGPANSAILMRFMSGDLRMRVGMVVGCRGADQVGMRDIADRLDRGHGPVSYEGDPITHRQQLVVS